MMLKSVFVFSKRGVLLFFIFAYISSYSQYVFESNKIPSKVLLSNYTSVADVGQRNLDFDFVLNNFQSLHPVPLNDYNNYLGFTTNNFWSLTALVNKSDVELHYYFETARPITDVVEMYLVDQSTGKIQKKISGDAMAYKDRSYPNRKNIFDLKIKPKANLKLLVHIRSDGDAVRFPLTFSCSESFIIANCTEELVFGFFYGILVIVAIIYFCFFIALKNSTFLYYSLYVIAIGLLQFGLDGYFYQYITPSGNWFSNHAVIFLAIIASLFAAKYGEVFFKIKENSKPIYRVFLTIYLMLFVLLLSVLIFPKGLPYFYQIINVYALIFLLFIMFVIGYLYYKKKQVDLFYTIGICFLGIGFFVFILDNIGFINSTILTQNSSKIGTGLEIVFLSLSMSNLIRKLKNENHEFNTIALAKSEEMNELKSYFLSNISHELRTPLNAITNMTDVVLGNIKDKNIKKNCEVIKYSSLGLLSSVNDILDFSKIEKKEVVIEKKEFDLLHVLKNVKFIAKKNSKEKKLKFRYIKPKIDRLILLGDPDRLIQILNNVLNNAVKFTSDGFVDFGVEIIMKTVNQIRLSITISDSGIGIPKEKIASIFDSFSQNKIDNKRKFGGLGLGLYIVKNLVEMQGGIVSVESKVGVGTTCKIVLDYDVVESKPIENIQVKKGIYDLGEKTLLVVEDNPMNQMVLKTITKKWLNTTVVYANNGQEGLDAFQNHKIDLVLMDLQMPVMDGYEATIAIRNGAVGAENAIVPIVAVTADVMQSTKLRVAEIGMNDYISKPVQKELLYKVVKELLG